MQNKMYEDTDSKTNAAFFSKQPPSVSSSKERKPVECDSCGKKGHTEDRCWKKAKHVGENQARFAHSSNQQSTDWSNGYAFRCSSVSQQARRQEADWFIDSGASQHMSDQRWAFVDYQSIKPGSWPVNGIGLHHKPLQATGFGSIPVSCRVGGNSYNGVLQKVLFVPNLGVNLYLVCHRQ